MMSFTSQSTTSLQSTTSNTPLVKAQSKKDYQGALSSLQATYGFGGSVSTPVHNSTSSTTAEKSATAGQKVASTSSSTTATSTLSQGSRRDYENAFATLSSSYGFGGQAPSQTPKQPRKNKP
ncbi:hypothetical protein AX16_004911 [Volvariella volvacea WC 439]|nr:hypothetical protein AX16_004911 [Volvariella volvacea WC 439]